MSRFETEDERHDADVVRYLDDWDEARAEDAARMDAYIEGQRLGLAGHGREMNAFPPDSPEWHECERGRLNAIGWRLGGRIAA